MARVNRPRFWEDIDARGGDEWELGRPAPTLADFLDTTPPAPGRVAVPGCGRGHDARLLAARGHDVTGFDFAPAALAAARALAARERVAVRFEDRDVFALGRECPRTLRAGGGLLAPAFTIERAFAPLRSARGRQGREWMVLARKTGA
jgi:methyl halide transferase